ncbi:Lsr2 family protein [Kineococcus glutinatus]|uniref:Lsr2 family protein n=1 Tax=Kineococcus glutinatus TaxID=1070872 RepID=A0ABP9HPQ4_9ACTN
MAQKTTVQLIDDLDGSEATATVRFSLDGVEYEIDLSDEHIDQLHEVLAPYVEAGRQTNGRSSGAGRQRRGKATSTKSITAVDLNAVRTWAREHGHKVSDRGRISNELLAKYQEAHAS